MHFILVNVNISQYYPNFAQLDQQIPVNMANMALTLQQIHAHKSNVIVTKENCTDFLFGDSVHLIIIYKHGDWMENINVKALREHGDLHSRIKNRK